MNLIKINVPKSGKSSDNLMIYSGIIRNIIFLIGAVYVAGRFVRDGSGSVR